jgi:three-Cys-motif partner protein
LLKKDGRIDEALKKRLDKIFGTTKWYEAFYKTETATSLFGEQAVTKKVANMEAIGQYFVKRMQKIFASVADNPRPLYNSKRNPLYLLCFASGNPKGATTAVKIAQDILAS